MAKVKIMLTGAFLLFLVFSYGITSSEERELKTESNNKCKKCVTIDEKSVREMAKSSSHNPKHFRRNNIAEYEADSRLTAPNLIPGVSDPVTEDGGDSRPTTPGHSPGAGHSTGPGSKDPN
ncbi:hypothetical protein L1049_025799 [Liquidambar formosana]|uniref:Uncharacterized protein n=1 Tax=Liquidambar formosana TaxID=63359 RepID=A0AAP0R6V2_LIQFO